MFSHRTLIVLACLCMLVCAVACGPSSEEVALIVNQTVEARSPEVVEEKVEVTRIVEVEIESEVTRIVEVEATVEVPIEVEVTRVVEIEITSTPEPTPTATATAVPQPTAVPQTSSGNGSSGGAVAASGDVNVEVLELLMYMKSRIDAYAANIGGGFIDCTIVVDIANEFASPRPIDLTNATPETQNGYANYVAAIETFQSGTFDLNDHCRNFLADPAGTDNRATGNKMFIVRNGVEETQGILRNIISALGGNPDA